MKRHALQWSHGEAEIYSTGAALHNLVFCRNGQRFAPLVEAPWQDDYLARPDPSLPRHLQLLGGEWPCVPFGSTRHDAAHHGHGTDHEWRLEQEEPGALTLSIDYPDNHAIKRLTRTVRGVDGQPRIEISLTITARRDCSLPIGVHPIFRLTDDVRLHPAPFSHGETFPEVFEPGQSVLTPACRFNTSGVVEAEGGALNLFETPCAGREELVQLFDIDGAITIEPGLSAPGLRLSWDKQALPHCLIWISNHGRTNPPWNGRFRGIGIEPVNSYFDINDRSPMGQGYGLALHSGQEHRLCYALELV